MDHHPHHNQQIPESNRIFGLAVLFNVVFVVVEGIAGFYADSLALLADAGHNLSDVAGLLIAWAGAALAARGASERHTYGMGRASIMAALANALLLMIAVGIIVWEALGRFNEPPDVNAVMVTGVALFGVLINVGTALLFRERRHHDLNAKGAYLHMAADAAVSMAVVLAGVAILYTGANWLDPAISLLVSVVIAWSTWGLLKESLMLAMDGVPSHIDPVAVRNYLLDIDGVADVHDLHIWAISTTENALTVHVVKSDGALDDALLVRLNEQLEQRFGIHHSTIQLEQGDGDFDCDQVGIDGACGHHDPGL
jgi:cobalt-zinc-cadmium efflux system protein